MPPRSMQDLGVVHLAEKTLLAQPEREQARKDLLLLNGKELELLWLLCHCSIGAQLER